VKIIFLLRIVPQRLVIGCIGGLANNFFAGPDGFPFSIPTFETFKPTMRHYQSLRLQNKELHDEKNSPSVSALPNR